MTKIGKAKNTRIKKHIELLDMPEIAFGGGGLKDWSDHFPIYSHNRETSGPVVSVVGWA